MERVLEPEYMDTADEVESYAAMDHTAANRSMVACFLEAGGGNGNTLDIGTGPADIPMLIAEQAPRAHIVALDAAHLMLVFAQQRIARTGLGDRIRLQQADAKNLPFRGGTFDGVLSNTILHHIAEPTRFLAEAHRVADSAGVIVIRDLCRPEDEGRARALVAKHAQGATEQQRQLLFDSLCASLTLDEARTAVDAAGMADATVEMTSDRHYTILRPSR